MGRMMFAHWGVLARSCGVSLTAGLVRGPRAWHSAAAQWRRLLLLLVFASLAILAGTGAAQAACGAGDTTTASTTGATMTFTGVGAGNKRALCPTEQHVLWGLFGAPDGSNPNLDAYNSLPVTGAGGFSTFSVLTATTAKATYTVTPVGGSSTNTPQYDIVITSLTGSGSDTVTLWYNSFCTPANQCGNVGSTHYTDTAFTLTINLPPVPVVTSVSPNAGPTAGGTSVTITGTDLTGATSVTFGGAAATSFTVVNATTITATTPAHAAGAVNIVVTSPNGSGTGTNAYTYAAAPTVTAINPTSGSTLGGTGVTITGTNLTGATSVTIGGVAPTGVTVVNATTITATTAAHAAGTVNVVVVTPGGTATGTGLYTYHPPRPYRRSAPPPAAPWVGRRSPSPGPI